jgi:flagellar motor switch protein FliN/FliY
MKIQQENEKTVETWRDFLDVQVELSIELGRTRMKVREILDLEAESIIKLSRSTGEGVDVRADNQSLMRGEFIVIEDHAGVRVSELTAENNR